MWHTNLRVHILVGSGHKSFGMGFPTLIWIHQLSICGCSTKTSWKTEGRLRTPCHTSNSKLNGKGINKHMSRPHSPFSKQVPGPLYMHHHKWSWDISERIARLGRIGFVNHARKFVCVCELVFTKVSTPSPHMNMCEENPTLVSFPHCSRFWYNLVSFLFVCFQ